MLKLLEVPLVQPMLRSRDVLRVNCLKNFQMANTKQSRYDCLIHIKAAVAMYKWGDNSLIGCACFCGWKSVFGIRSLLGTTPT